MSTYAAPVPLDPNRLDADLVAQLDALGAEFVQAITLDVDYLIVMLRQGGKQAEKRGGLAPG